MIPFGILSPNGCPVSNGKHRQSGSLLGARGRVERLTPVLVLPQVNFAVFISIVRILLQKLRSPDVGGNDQSQYK
ncbi:hypothetical protein lerEdw1_019233 [Lerista edwardsae]|nr:hypothetical protein lerEdw1_019233 [Lerista edwardsae]